MLYYMIKFVSVALMILGISLSYNAYGFAKNAERAVGLVLDQNRTDLDDGPVFRPLIAFIDQNNVKQNVQTSIASSKYNFPNGSQVDILFDTRNPDIMHIDNWYENWGFGAYAFAIGLGLFFLTGLVWKILFRARTKPASLDELRASVEQNSDKPRAKRPTIRRND